MLDMSKVQKRYWDVKLPNGLFLSVESPKLKTLRKMSAIGGTDNDKSIENMVESLAMALSKNKQNKQITIDFIERNFDVDVIITIFESYIDWVSSVKNDPN